MMDMKTSNYSETIEAKISFSELLELAADNDVEGFKLCIESNPVVIDEIGLWYGRQLGGVRGMVLEYRTPLMVASMYGSLDVMKAILSHSKVDVNRSCGTDKCTALHCAASGGSIDAVKLLLAHGADPNLVDAKGNRPCDVMLPELQVAIEDLLTFHDSTGQKDLRDLGNGLKDLRDLGNGLKDLRDLGNGLKDLRDLGNGLKDLRDLGNGLKVAPSSPMSSKKEYPVDPSLPDIKNTIYSTDEFRMYSFKVRPCSRPYSHDWTECPFVHPGENARRRDPRKYHYSCVPCPEFRKGTCRRGDMCEYAHGVFECWLHPAQYRTRLCKDGTSCNRRVCFFAHLVEELRPLYASTGSAVSSPRSVASAAAVMDMAAALNLFPGSPSGYSSAMSPSPFTPPLSPSGKGYGPGRTGLWTEPTPNPLYIVPGRDENFKTGHNLLFSPSHKSDMAAALNLFPGSPSGSPSATPFTPPLSPSGIGCGMARVGPTPSPLCIVPGRVENFKTGPKPLFSPSHKSAVFNHFHQQQQSMLSPINTKPVDHHHTLLQPSFGPSSPSMMMSSPRGIEPQSSFSARFSALALRDKQQQMRSLSARDLGANLPRDLIPENGEMAADSPMSVWESSSNGRADWSINGDDFSHLKRSHTVGHYGEEPDLSWVRSLVKDPPSFENKEVQSNAVSGSMLCADGSNSNSQAESVDSSAFGAWLDQIAAQ